MKISSIAIDTERCITYRDVECGVCAHACPVGETALRMDSRRHPAARARLHRLRRLHLGVRHDAKFDHVNDHWEAFVSGKTEVRIVPKPWGHETIWAHTDLYVGKSAAHQGGAFAFGAVPQPEGRDDSSPERHDDLPCRDGRRRRRDGGWDGGRRGGRNCK